MKRLEKAGGGRTREAAHLMTGSIRGGSARLNTLAGMDGPARRLLHRQLDLRQHQPAVALADQQGPGLAGRLDREAVAVHSLDGAVDAYLAILSEAGRNGRDAQDGRDALASSRGSVSEWTRRSSSRS